MKPACMTEDEYAAWASANVRVMVPRQMAPSPCSDCTIAFYLEQRSVGTCDGFPRLRRPRSETNAPARERARRRMREAWAAA